MSLRERALAASSLCLLCLGCGTDEPFDDRGARALPSALPFEFERPDEGEPVPAEEITAFTRRLTGLFRRVALGQWLLRVGFGYESDAGPEFLAWWTYVVADKQGAVVTHRVLETGVPDNLMGPTAELTTSVSAGYLLSGDAELGRMVELLSKGVTAQFQGMVFAEGEPVPPIMARAVMPPDHAKDLGGGLVKRTDYSAWRYADTQWNVESFEVSNNPFWGPIWIRNLRSKDDVAQLYRAAAWLRYVAERGADAAVRDAAATAAMHMQRFATDVLEQGYRIATRAPDGTTYVPEKDLASFVQYELFTPNAECNGKLGTALLATGETQGNDCQDGFGGAYEPLAIGSHYFNVNMIRRFHFAALMLALVTRQDAAARGLLEGLAKRANDDMHREGLPKGATQLEWDIDLATFLMRASSAGLPLTSLDVRHVLDVHDRALDELEVWPYWDLWSPELPDGTYPPQPFPGLGMWDMMTFFDYCASPFRNPAGRAPVDCEILSDPARWEP